MTRPEPPGVLLPEFLDAAPELPVGVRARLVDVAIALLDEVYVHLPQKRARYGVDPVQQLRLLRDRVTQLRAGAFRDELSTIFTSLHDRHTGYVAPEPWMGRAAALPFLVERYVDDGRPRYVVSKVVEWGPIEPSFDSGVEVTHWNGVPIDRAVERNALRQRGANPPARTARGVQALTVRSLAHSLPPDEHWVNVGYRTNRGARREARFAWRVMEVEAAPDADDANPMLGNDPGGVAVQQVRKELFAAPRLGAPWIPTSLPKVFAARRHRAAGGDVGHVRIWSFAERDDVAATNEFARLLGLLPRRGVIIDIRGNPGGYIPSAERLLQTLTAGRVEPARFSLATTRTTLAMCRADDVGLGRWATSIRGAVGTGDVYSQGFPITPEAVANDLGRCYDGPAVLVTDALTYSAADIFAAGFQDHGIGTVVGTGAATGAGGANVWTARQVEALTAELGDAWPALPEGAGGFTVAFRRATRVGERVGLALEDVGVEVDQVVELTRDDLLRSNRDLLATAAALL